MQYCVSFYDPSAKCWVGYTFEEKDRAEHCYDHIRNCGHMTGLALNEREKS